MAVKFPAWSRRVEIVFVTLSVFGGSIVTLTTGAGWGGSGWRSGIWTLTIGGGETEAFMVCVMISVFFPSRSIISCEARRRESARSKSSRHFASASTILRTALAALALGEESASGTIGVAIVRVCRSAD